MSKKKISQIVGLTIGATAIAATGIGSSIALTSCTAPTNETSDNVAISGQQLNNVMTGLKEAVTNLGYNAIANFDSSNIYPMIINEKVISTLATDGVTITNQAIESTTVTPSFNDLEGTETHVSLNANVTITFSNSISLPSESDLTDYPNISIDGQAVTFTDVVTNLANPDIIDIDNTQAETIWTNVNDYLSNLDPSVYSDTQTLNGQSITNVVKSIIVNGLQGDDLANPVVKISTNDIGEISFDEKEVDNGQNLNVTVSITFADNIQLQGWADSSYFDVNGQTITNTNNPFVLKNPTAPHDTDLASNLADAIYATVQTAVVNKSQESGFSLDQLSSLSNQLKQTVANKIGINQNQINTFELTPNSPTDADQTANVNFNLTFSDTVNLVDNWTKMSLMLVVSN